MKRAVIIATVLALATMACASSITVESRGAAIARPVTVPAVCTVTADALHHRAAPNIDAEILGYFAAGDNVMPTGTTAAGWMEVTRGGVTGWSKAEYLFCQQ